MMKRRIKILWNNICIFIEFSFFIDAVIAIWFHIISPVVTYLEKGMSKLLNLSQGLAQDIVFYGVPALLLVFIIFVAFKKKYVIFTKKEHYQNILSSVVLLLILIWFNKCYKIVSILYFMLISAQF